jgi:hypothetical protein
VLDDSPDRRLVVVRGDDGTRAPELVRAGREVDKVLGQYVPVPATTVARRRPRRGRFVQREALLVGQRRGLAVVPVTTGASEPFATRCAANARNASRSRDPSALKGVAIAVRISPSTKPILRDRGIPMVKEFRDFLLRGNLLELAVAFVMGLAFAALVTSFVDDLIMPIVAMIFSEPDAASPSRSTTRTSATAPSLPDPFVTTAAASSSSSSSR